MSALSARTYALLAIAFGVGAAIAGAGVVIFLAMLGTIGRFDAPADDTPMTLAIRIAVVAGALLVLISRFWKTEQRTFASAMMLGAGFGLVADGAFFLLA